VYEYNFELSTIYLQSQLSKNPFYAQLVKSVTWASVQLE